MAVHFKFDKEQNFNLLGEDLISGEIYQGSDGLIYVGFVMNNICAVGFGHDTYVTTGHAEGEGDISFRLLNAEVTITQP